MNIPEYMVKYSLTVQQFADKFKLNKRTVFRYINGESVPSRLFALSIEMISNGELTYAELRKHAKKGI